MVAWLLVLGAVAYFGQYYDHGFNVGDEGSVVLITERLLAGERPYLDVELGYGLLWFYPLALLFKMTGVSFIATRIYFLLLALVTSLLALLAIRKQTGSSSLAAAVALLILAFPGTLHKTYIPLIVVANICCLPLLGNDRRVLDRSEILTAGLVAAVSYHIRPDLGLSAALVLVTILTIQALIGPSDKWQRLRQMGRMAVWFGVAALVPTAPLLLIARHQGFTEAFLDLLWQPVLSLLEIVGNIGSRGIDLFDLVSRTQVAWAAPVQAPESPPSPDVGIPLARIPLTAVWQGPGRDLAILTYLPLLTLALIAGCIGYRMIRGVARGQSSAVRDALGVAAALGLAYSAYPQFFLFRPDAAHLSQFMPGYVVLVGICLGRWLLPMPADRARASPTLLARWAAVGVGILHLGFYAWFALHQPSTGTIAMARGRTERFHGANGVDVAVRPGQWKLLTRVTRVVEESTSDGDVVLCFPYCPGFNVVTRRPTFMRRLYVDDGMLILEPGWQQRTIEWIEIGQAPLIIIQDWAPNGTDISRFKNWATEVMAHLAASYELVDRVGGTRFYRRSAVASGPSRGPAASEVTSSSSGSGRRFAWRTPGPALGAPRRETAHETAHETEHEVRAEPTAERTEAYLRTLDVADLARRGSDFGSSLSDLRRLAEQLGRPVGELTNGRDYDFDRLEEIEGRLEGVDREQALAAIFEQVTDGASSDTGKHLALADFLARAMRAVVLNPTYREDSLRVQDPLVLLELGEGGSGRVATVAVDLWRAAGMEARQVKLGRHIVAELEYDGGWHYFDARSHDGGRSVRNAAGTVPSLAELSRTPLAIDRPASYLEPWNGRVARASTRYPSYSYFGVCPDCKIPKTYRYKTGTGRRQARDLYFGWCAVLTRQEPAEDIVLSAIPARFQPGAPSFVGVDIETPEAGTAAVTIRWERSLDGDGDLLGYRVYVSRESRGWSYEPEGAAPEILPYWSHPAGWEPSMVEHLFELPKSEVALVTTEVEEARLTLEAGHTYYLTVMPFDAHGEAVGRQLYRASQELEIALK